MLHVAQTLSRCYFLFALVVHPPLYGTPPPTVGHRGKVLLLTVGVFLLTVLLRTKNHPREEVFGTDTPRTSGGHSRGYPGPKLRSGQSKSWKNKHFGTDIHDPKVRTSMTPRGFQKLRSEKLWAEFSFHITVLLRD